MNAIQKHLNALPEPYNLRALKGYEQYPLKPFNNVLNGATALICFKWSETVEGFQFWFDVRESLMNNEPMPSIPMAQ